MSSAFACAQYPSAIVMDFTPTFAGASVTGAKYLALLNGIINSAGFSFPGPTAGSTATGGQFQ